MKTATAFNLLPVVLAYCLVQLAMHDDSYTHDKILVHALDEVGHSACIIGY